MKQSRYFVTLYKQNIGNVYEHEVIGVSTHHLGGMSTIWKTRIIFAFNPAEFPRSTIIQNNLSTIFENKYYSECVHH